ncbi:putative short chain type dehydrogenase [Massarina eburnea CBS 473.64]|uniref:Putative short chain type dehydrogenase n=1 Tax=Massarina eburnea CBS 473.64 TaxID=1395130 RepID=A0A6A6RVQ8_9PLEO|nr:putative short chain type dehydrogenase [Massarina eburnea CBS 473.64]
MPGRLQDKVATVTGASSGIGRAIALLYAREGAKIVCSDLQEHPRNIKPEEGTTVEDIEKAGGTAIFVKCDTSKVEEVQNLIAKTVEKFGRLDIMVNNAGIGDAAHSNPIWDADEAHFDLTIAINLTGVFYGTKYASRQMKSQDPHPSGDRGWIINLGSVLGLNGQPDSSGYVASKHGVLGLTKCAAWDCAQYRIHVNAVCPGYTSTSMTHEILQHEGGGALEKMHPFRGFGSPEDIAKGALFLASEDASWVTAVALPVDGGYNSR